MECQNREYFLSSTESDPKSISDSESSGHYSVVISLRILDLAFLDLFEAESEKIYIPFVSSFRRGEKEKKTQAVSPVTWKDSSKKRREKPLVLLLFSRSPPSIQNWNETWGMKKMSAYVDRSRSRKKTRTNI